MEDIRSPDVVLMRGNKAFMTAIWERRLKDAQTIAFQSLGDMKRVNIVMDVLLGRNLK